MNYKKLIFILLVVFMAALSFDSLGAEGIQPTRPSAEELLKFAVPDSTPELNYLDPSSPLYGKIPPPPPRKVPPTFKNRMSTASLLQVNDWWGTNIFQVNPAPSSPGVYAEQQVITNLTIPNNSDLYAPTLLSPNRSRYEAVTAYHNHGSMVRNFAVYDHASGTWVLAKSLDATFTSKYTSGGYYTTIIRKISGAWYVYLWNYQTGQYEIQVGPQSGDGDHDYGWDIYESYLSSCSDLSVFRSRALAVVTTSGWQDVTSSYGDEWSNLPTCQYTTNWISQYYSWSIEPR